MHGGSDGLSLPGGVAMRTRSRRLGRPLLSALGVLATVFALAPAAARAQVPQPIIPDTAQRSGLIGRFVPIDPFLPPDPKRELWYDTRWGDRPHGHRPNSVKEGG